MDLNFLKKYQKLYKYILVDEYQDTNYAQYTIVKMIAKAYQNICVVGDDAQSIYSFRGANIENILNFRNDYTNSKSFKLEQNYRSSKNIVAAANAIISKNKDQFKKDVWTTNDDGPRIKVIKTKTENEEGRVVADKIITIKLEHQLLNHQFAILYRTNAQSRAIEDALRKREIEYKIYGGLSFYQRKEIKDVMAYLRLVINNKDEESLKRIINYPARGIGQTTINKLIVASKKYNITLFDAIKKAKEINLNINHGTINKLENFVTLIERFQIENELLDAFEITDLIIKKIGILTELKNDATPENISKIENIEELLNGIRDFTEGQKELSDASGNLDEFLEDVPLITDLDNKDDANSDKVSLMTIHLAKGLEFPYVFVVGLEEDLFPSALSLNTRAELEEERRLFYVALTRAKKRAFLSYTLSRYRWGKLVDAEPSRFIDEIDKDYVNHIKINSNYSFKPIIDTSIFQKQQSRKISRDTSENKISNPSIQQLSRLRKIRQENLKTDNDTSIKIKEGMSVEHARFGHGTVINIEGKGSDKKAIINFQSSGVKNLLLRFAKLKIK